MNMYILRNDDRGMVSITVTMILMIIISITVLSFAQVIRREQRESLDNQLSSQAFYAAETGVNDAQNYIKEQVELDAAGSNPQFANGIPSKTTCKNDGAYAGLKPSLDNEIQDAENDTDSEYTCLLIDPAPDNLQYSLTPAEGSKVFPMKPLTPGERPTSIRLTWTPQEGGSDSGCSTSLSATNPASGGWSCGFAMLRLDLAPIDAPYARRDALNDAVFGSFAVPTRNVNTSAVYQAGKINRNPAKCDGKECTMTITNLPNNNDNYYMRVGAVYKTTTLTVTALSGTKPIQLKDSQLKLDSTGRAQDVLRRIQVRVPLNYQGLHAENAITSNEEICKRFKAFYNEDTPAENAKYNNSGC